MLVLVNLRENPAARNHCMSFQEFEIGACTHLRTNHTRKVAFNRKNIYQGDTTVFNNQHHVAAETLCFAPFPVEVHAYGHVVHFKCGILGVGSEHQHAVMLALPLNHAVACGCECLGACSCLLECVALIGLQKRDTHLRSVQNAYLDCRFSLHCRIEF